MQKILIENPGTPYFNGLAQKMQDLLEFDLGVETETVSGDPKDSLKLLTESGAEIGTFTSLPAKETLRLYISLGT